MNTTVLRTRPTVVSYEKDRAFAAKAREMQLDPADPWIGGYVDYEWDHLRVILEEIPVDLKGLRVLEFGCNVGASATLFSLLGADVCAVDVAEDWVRLAELNAIRYDAGNIRFFHVPDTRTLPFPNDYFDLISCNSVLEYVDENLRPRVQQELDRVVRVGGKILLQGTSSRLWPREVHSRRWLVNYLPLAIDSLLGRKIQRGMWPWEARYGFGPHYINLDSARKDSYFVRSREKLGVSSLQLRLLTQAALWLKVAPGLLCPNISCLLQKVAKKG